MQEDHHEYTNVGTTDELRGLSEIIVSYSGCYQIPLFPRLFALRQEMSEGYL